MYSFARGEQSFLRNEASETDLMEVLLKRIECKLLNLKEMIGGTGREKCLETYTAEQIQYHVHNVIINDVPMIYL